MLVAIEKVSSYMYKEERTIESINDLSSLIDEFKHELIVRKPDPELESESDCDLVVIIRDDYYE